MVETVQNESFPKISAVVLAAGKGTRMKSTTPKVLLDICGQPVLCWSLSLLLQLGFKDIKLVVLHKKKDIKKSVDTFNVKVDFIDQKKALGTAHAVSIATKKISNSKKHILVLFGDDSALYKKETISDFITNHLNQKSKMSILTTSSLVAKPIGGLKRDIRGNVIGVATQEELAASGQKKIDIVCGAFCFEKEWLKKNLQKVPKTKSSGEYPLPGLIRIAAEQGYYPNTVQLKDKKEWNSMNTPDEYKEAIRKKKSLLKNEQRTN